MRVNKESGWWELCHAAWQGAPTTKAAVVSQAAAKVITDRHGMEYGVCRWRQLASGGDIAVACRHAAILYCTDMPHSRCNVPLRRHWAQTRCNERHQSHPRQPSATASHSTACCEGLGQTLVGWLLQWQQQHSQQACFTLPLLLHATPAASHRQATQR